MLLIKADVATGLLWHDWSWCKRESENCDESSWSTEEELVFDNTLFVCLWPSSRFSSECTVILRQPIHHNRNSVKDITNCGTGTVDKNVQNKTKLLSWLNLWEKNRAKQFASFLPLTKPSWIWIADCIKC